MNVLRVSWRQSLAAAALAAFLGPMTADATADDVDGPPKPAQLKEGSPVDQVLLAQRGERGREAREGREHHEPEAREEREHHERDGDAEHREREHRHGDPDREARGERQRDIEHREREARERPGRERAELTEGRNRLMQLEREKAETLENAEREIGELERAYREVEEDREEIGERMEDLERELVELREELEEEAHEEEEEDDEEDDEDEDEDEIGELEEEIEEIEEHLEKARDVRAALAKRAEDVKRELTEHRSHVQRRVVELEREFKEVHGQLERFEHVFADRNPERAEAMERIQAMAREIAELRRAGKHEEARRVQEEMIHLHRRLAGALDRDRPGSPDAERREAMERIGAMTRELAELRRTGHHEKAERVQHEIHELHRHLAGGPREGDRPDPHPELERIAAITRELVELRRSGRHEAAEELQRELHELHRRLAGGPREEDRPGPPPELQVKIDHLHAAMENLHAAGLHEQAEQIAGQIEQMTREHRPDARGPRPEGRPGPHPQEELVERLHGEIERLNRQDDEMRHLVDELRKSQEQMMQHMEKQTHEMHQMMEKLREALHANEPHDHEHN